MKTKVLFIAFLMTAFFNANAQVNLSYLLDETSLSAGAILSEDNGSGKDLTLVGSTTITSVPGKLGTAISFPTPNTTTCFTSSFSNTNFNSFPMSFSIWIKTNMTANRTHGSYLFMLGNTANNSGIGILLGTTNGIAAYCRKDNGLNAGCGTNAKNLVNDGQWHNIVVTYGSMTSKKIYVDKVEITDVTCNSANDFTGFPFLNTIAIGGWKRGSVTDPSENLALDQALLTNQELTQTQIDALYNISTAVRNIEMDKVSPFKIINGSLVIPSEIDRTSVTMYNALGTSVDLNANLANSNFYIIRYKNNGQDRVSKIMNW